MFGWIVVIVCIAVVAFFVARARSNSARKTKVPARPKYAGLAFVADKHCCDAATTMNGRRFLISEAPKVPLSTCSDPALCRCKYRNVNDRRAGDDRRSVVGALSTDMPIGDERANHRGGRERRKESISFDYDS